MNHHLVIDRKCGFLVWLSEVRRTEPVRIEKKDCRGWVVLTPGKDFGLLVRSNDGTKAPDPPVENHEKW